MVEMILTPEAYGVRPEGVPITNEYLDIIALEDQKVHLKTAIWKRKDLSLQTDFQGQKKPIEQQFGSAVFLSGFGARGEDWPIAF